LNRALVAFGLTRTLESPPRKILFVKLEEQGALVVAVPAIRRAERLVGRENLYFVSFDQNRQILDLMGLLPEENIFQIRSHHPLHIVLDTLKVVWRVRRIGIDATVDMEFFARGSAVLTYLCGSSRRVGLHGFDAGGPYRGDLMTHRVFYNPYLHTADAYDVLVRALEQAPLEVPLLKAPVAATREALPRYASQSGGHVRIRALLDSTLQGRSGMPVVVFHTNCSDVLRVRKWPEENYVALGREIVQAYPEALIVLTGLEREGAESRKLAAAIGPDRAVSLAGALTLEELLCLFNVSDVVVTNDSGPGHFAGLTSAHLVVLYGPETPALFGPLGVNSRVLYKSFACSPCLTAFNFRLSPCSDNLCIKSISVAEVFEAVCASLQERDGATTC